MVAVTPTDGTAPYFTVMVPPTDLTVERPLSDDELLACAQRWSRIKTAASAALLEFGGTCTHHHAVGRDHRVFHGAEVGDVFVSALQAFKSSLDPVNIMNPGTLLPVKPVSKL
jgi:FAD/FMN-containing dehydrogenase